MFNYNNFVKVFFWFSLFFTFVFWFNFFFRPVEVPHILPDLVDSLQSRTERRNKVIDSLAAERQSNAEQLQKLDTIIKQIENDTNFYNNYIKRFRPDL